MYSPLVTLANSRSSSNNSGGNINIDPSLFYRKDQDVIINNPNTQLATYVKTPTQITRVGNNAQQK